nr:hypothetical protein [uncultured Bacteroides sp.]
MKKCIVLLIVLITISCSSNKNKNDMNFFNKLFGKKEFKETPKREFTNEEYEKNDELKMNGLEAVLGKSYKLVGHAIIPFAVGGTVDMYYFPNGISGTGFATMELIDPEGNGPIPNKTGTYELVAFTKLKYSEDTTETNPFNKIERRICGIFTGIANYSYEAKLEPNETCELPQDEGEPNLCLIFDDYKPNGAEFKIGNQKYGLLLTIEVFRDEMEYAMSNGTEKLIQKLKERGFYPYSDLDRKSVID